LVNPQGQPEGRAIIRGDSMAAIPVVVLRPLVRFREFPFGTAHDPSMREAMSPRAWEYQEQVLEYLRSGLILGVTMGADLTDWFAPSEKANPVIEGNLVGGTTEMTDGTWFWYAGLIHFVEKYHVRLPEDFVRHAARQGWRVQKERIPPQRYEWSYFGPSPTSKGALA
jgi:hypothetical protein